MVTELIHGISWNFKKRMWLMMLIKVWKMLKVLPKLSIFMFHVGEAMYISRLV